MANSSRPTRIINEDAMMDNIIDNSGQKQKRRRSRKTQKPKINIRSPLAHQRLQTQTVRPNRPSAAGDTALYRKITQDNRKRALEPKEQRRMHKNAYEVAAMARQNLANARPTEAWNEDEIALVKHRTFTMFEFEYEALSNGKLADWHKAQKNKNRWVTPEDRLLVIGTFDKDPTYMEVISPAGLVLIKTHMLFKAAIVDDPDVPDGFGK